MGGIGEAASIFVAVVVLLDLLGVGDKFRGWASGPNNSAANGLKVLIALVLSFAPTAYKSIAKPLNTGHQPVGSDEDHQSVGEVSHSAGS